MWVGVAIGIGGFGGAALSRSSPATWNAGPASWPAATAEWPASRPSSPLCRPWPGGDARGTHDHPPPAVAARLVRALVGRGRGGAVRLLPGVRRGAALGVLIMGYFLGHIGNLLPMPGGVGGVEGGMVGVFVACGMPLYVAVVGTIAYQVISTWLPVAPGLAAYWSLRRRVARWRSDALDDDELQEAAFAGARRPAAARAERHRVPARPGLGGAARRLERARGRREGHARHRGRRAAHRRGGLRHPRRAHLAGGQRRRALRDRLRRARAGLLRAPGRRLHTRRLHVRLSDRPRRGARAGARHLGGRSAPISVAAAPASCGGRGRRSSSAASRTAADAFALAFALGVGVCIASYTLVDDHGVEHAAALPYFEVVLLICALPYAAGVAHSRGSRRCARPPTAARCPPAWGWSAPMCSCWPRWSARRRPPWRRCARRAS